MKIIRISEELKAPEERRAPPGSSAPTVVPVLPLLTPPQRESDDVLKKEFDIWRTQVASELRQNALTVAKLNAEIQELRKTILEMSKPAALAPVTPPPATPPAEPPRPVVLKVPDNHPVIEKEKTPPMPNRLLDAVAGSEPKQPEKKAAFLSKVWDHLNQVAFEAPQRKGDRKP